MERTHRLNVRITTGEWEMLKTMADAKGISASDYVRMFIRETFATAFGDASDTARSKRK